MTTDTRPWNIESSYYKATTTQVRSQFDGLAFTPSKPIKAWGLSALYWFGVLSLIGAIVLCLGRW